ncbi:glycosyltransferase family 4 protein [Arthrobacter sulfonylureivorans]|uniref:glycosyltransferase family 4 protein n=1 Tax=Arthrobacter sulfonylureivorans TaxID=2486855 RepID=UPI0039E2556C
MITIDTRFTGHHGIARYAREVTGRLSGLEWSGLSSGRNPSSPAGLLDGFRLGRSTRLFYTPGFNPLASAVPQLLTLHDLIHLRPGLPNRSQRLAYYEALIRPVIRRLGRVLTVSETSAEEIRRWLRDDTVEVINAGNGCSGEFTPDAAASTPKRPYLLYVGALRPHKNVPTMLTALAGLPEARLIVVSPDHTRFGTALARHGLSQRSEVLSGLDDRRLASLYRGAAATVLPSTAEGFGLPAVESLSCGTPVVYWQGCNSVHEICAGYGTAVASATDVGQWREALRNALEQPQPVSGFDAGRFCWNRVADRVGGVLRGL